ncbi:hypothetical protein J1N35_022355 [Gossypium stocksii]|uniref:Uncharacterized protein n=1 Tax=Gossypium stocksii TaxID=47602 RepID=A0A9D3VIB7_9ROSI|nr:hypothetical protein J1N35_022355 [Gossypium stocksii]
MGILVAHFKYELFDVKGELELEAVISWHCSSKNAVMQLYLDFFEADGAHPSSTTVATNAGIEAETKSLTTQLCDGSGLYKAHIMISLKHQWVDILWFPVSMGSQCIQFQL